MKRQQTMKIMKDMIRKIRSKGRMDASNSWWVSELVAADCEKAWLHAGLEDTMQKLYDWLAEMKKKFKQRSWKMCTNEKVSQMIKGAVGSAGLLHKITKPTA